MEMISLRDPGTGAEATILVIKDLSMLDMTPGVTRARGFAFPVQWWYSPHVQGRR